MTLALCDFFETDLVVCKYALPFGGRCVGANFKSLLFNCFLKTAFVIFLEVSCPRFIETVRFSFTRCTSMKCEYQTTHGAPGQFVL